LVGQVALNAAQVRDGFVAGLTAKEGVDGLPTPMFRVAVGETHDGAISILAHRLPIRFGGQPAVALGRAVTPLSFRVVAQANVTFT